MKIPSNSLPAPITSGDMVVHNVGISDDPEDQLMILNVLSNTLYTDKPAAVLREYGCNAADANVEAGRGDTPIEVRLPHKLDPTLAIRDFGFGMTEEQILNTFIKLGRSTKRNSNAFTGMLGIGSKAGFAYGDSFLVTSYTGGTKAIYNLYRDRGAPKLSKMHEEPSDAPDGVEVKVPVRQEDMQEFANKARQIYSYFRVRPNITGAKIDWVPREILCSGAGWRYTGSSGSVAIMGNVAYKLDATAMGMGSHYHSYGTPVPREAALIDAGVELEFTIGELEIAANREGLQYSDLTKKALTQALGQATVELGKEVAAQIAGAKSLWEAKLLYHKSFEASGALRHVITGNLMWNGVAISNAGLSLANKEQTAGVLVSKYWKQGSSVRGYSAGGSDHVSVTPTVTLILNDLPSKKHSPSRLKGWFNSNPDCSEVVVFTFVDAKTEQTYWTNRKLDGAPTVPYSTITPTVSAAGSSGPSQHNSKHSATVFALDETHISVPYGNPKSLWWVKKEVDLKKDSGVYVVIDTFAVVRGGARGPEHPEAFREKVALLRGAGLLKGDLLGFKPDRAAKLGPNWVKLDVSVKTQMDLLTKTANFPQELADSLAEQAYMWLMPPKYRTQFTAGTSIRKLFDEAHRMANPTASKALRKLVFSTKASPWLETPALPKASFDLEKQEAQVMRDYPMLARVPRHDLSCAEDALIKTVVDYTQLVELN